MKGLLSFDIQMEQMLSSDEGNVWMSSRLSPRLLISSSAVDFGSLTLLSFFRHIWRAACTIQGRRTCTHDFTANVFSNNVRH